VIRNQDFPEYLLHFIWRYGLFNKENLLLIDGSLLDIVFPGTYHKDSGPDFHQARIKIADTLWAGNVEIHLKASDWFKHKHQFDSAYGSVILHVVFDFDAEVPDMNGLSIPVLELRKYIPNELLKRWRILVESMFSIPCAEIGRVDVLTMHNWLDRLIVERLEQRSGQISQTIKSCKYDWQEAFHVFLFRAMGMHVNALPFEMLARKVPYDLVQKHRQSSFQLEALLFGQSGLLPPETNDEYVRQLIEEYRYLAAKYSLKAMDAHVWKFMRMRPSNFPSLRIAQLAAIHVSSNIALERFAEINNAKEMLGVFLCEPSPFWTNYYSFSHSSPASKKKLGKDTALTLILNAVIPFLFEYAAQRSNGPLRESCLEWLYEMKAESNSVVREWTSLGIQPDSAAASQALIHLKRTYCDARRCLECAVGHRLLRDTVKNEMIS
jgi:hypothetical protein